MAFEDFAEYGKSSVDSDWKTVSLSQSYSRDIAIFATVTSFNDGAPSSDRTANSLAPVQIRLRNISKGSGATAASFDIRIQRPETYASSHPTETVSFLAIQEGTWDLVDGTRMAVGIFDRATTRTSRFQTVTLPSAFNAKPGVLSQIQTYEGEQWALTRHKNVSVNSFELTIQENEAKEANDQYHLIESIAYLAFDDGFTTTDGSTLLEGKLLDSSSQKIDHDSKSFTFETTTFSSAPVILTQNSDYAGGNPAIARLSALTTTGFEAYIQEDQSRDQETWHLLEEFSYIAIGEGTKFTGENVSHSGAPSIQGFSGDPGDATSSISINENNTEVGILSANESVTWSLTGGADSALFTLNATTGETTFSSTQDYESPGDSDANNSFIVEVTATDSDNNTSSQTITINLTDLDETPPTAIDNTAKLKGSQTDNINILANDNDNIDSPEQMSVYSVGDVLFDDLHDSSHTGTYSTENNYKQVTGDQGTLYIKQDGSSYYIKSSNSSLVRLINYSNALIQSRDTPNTRSVQLLTTHDIFSYVTADSSGNTSNAAIIRLESNTADSSSCESLYLVGTEFGNSFRGCCQADRLFGLGGNDYILGEEGDDRIEGGSGDDTLFGGTGDDVINGGDDADRLIGNQGNDVINGNQHDDFIHGKDGEDYLRGGKGNDWINGNIGDDKIHGDLGNDVLLGGKNNDWINGNIGDDKIHGDLGDDVLLGGKNNDWINGNIGDDEIYGDLGNDLIRGGIGDDTISGGAGEDELWGDFGKNIFLSAEDGESDLIVIKSDQHLFNWHYQKSGNNTNGEKADIIQGLDSKDELIIVGAFTNELTFSANVSAHGVSGVGIFAKGCLEALYTGNILSTNQIQSMTTGDASSLAMNNQQSFYWHD